MKRFLDYPTGVVLSLFAGLACQPGQPAADEDPSEMGSAASASVEAALGSVTADGLLSHIEVLSSDEYEGRAPGTAGEELTVDYLIGRFQKLGFKPGNPDGTFIQDVPLVGLTAEVTEASFLVGGEAVSMKGKDDFTAFTSLVEPEVSIRDSEIVFVGYGVAAPEYDWDDFKGTDLAGKTLLMLVNDPAIAHGILAHPDGGTIDELPPGRVGPLLIGPEGGFTPDEEGVLEDEGWPRVRLGRYVLRAETAAIAGAAVFSFHREGLHSTDV